jgi:hypothetical protein
MYIKQESNGMWTLRQERFLSLLEKGKEHPHDVCAIARDYEELKAMCEKHWPAAFKAEQDFGDA